MPTSPGGSGPEPAPRAIQASVEAAGDPAAAAGRTTATLTSRKDMMVLGLSSPFRLSGQNGPRKLILGNAPSPYHGRAVVDAHLIRGSTGHLPRSAARNVDGSTNGLLRAGAKEGRIGPGELVMAGW